MANILTVPESGIYFDGNTAGSSAIPTLTGNASGVAIQYDGYAGITISSSATGVDYQDRFSIEGENGRLFGVSDQVVGSVFSVNDAAGLPLIDVEVEQDFSKITLGQFGTDALVISGSSVQVTGSNVVTEDYLSDQSYLTSSTETYSTASELLAALLGVDGANSNLDADKLDGQQGSYYLNYNNFSNTPTIPAAANNTTITLSGGTEITTSIGDFTTNQSSPETLTINHAEVSRTNTTSTASPAFGGTFTVVDGVTSNARGHVTAENVKTITLPSLGTTSTTALAGDTTVNDVSEANLKSRLAALDSNDTIYIGDAGDDTTVVIRGTLQVDGSTTTVNSTTITVDDKNIELGSVASPSDSLADGGGITLKGSTDKTITWIDSTDSWTSNQTFSSPNLTLTSLSAQNSEATALMINDSNVVGTRELGSNAFNSTSYLPLAGGTMTGSLQVSVGGATGINIKQDTGSPNISGRLFFSNQTAGEGVSIYNADNKMMFQTGATFDNSTGSTRMTILASGNVGIGTTSPATRLHVLQSGTAVSSDGVSSLVVQKSAAAGTAAAINIVSGDSAEASLRFGDTTDQSMGALRYFNDVDAFSIVTNNAEQIRITSSGNVGIGTTSPSELLEVSSNTGAADGTTNPTTIRISDTDNGSAWDTTNSFANLDFYSADSSGSGAGTKARVGAIAENSTGAQIGLAFSTTYSTDDISEKLRIDASGNVGIGTTSPSNKLHVYGGRIVVDNLASQQSAIQFSSAGTEKTVLYRPSNSDDFRIYKAGISNDALTILNSNGNVGIGTNNPVAKLTISDSGGTGLEIHAQDSLARVAMVAYDRADSAYREIYSEGYNFNFNTSGTNTRLSILNNGNVGIGTTSPSNKLTVEDTIGIKRSGVAAITTLQQTGTGLILNAPSGYHPFVIQYNGAEYARFTNGGDLGIGTASPSHKLEVGLTSSVALANQPAEPLFVSNDGNGVDGRVFISVKHDGVNTASAVGAGFKMTAAAVTSGTASYDDSLIFLRSAGTGNDTVHSAPKAIKFYVDNHDTNAGSGANYADLGDLALTIGEDTNATFTGDITAASLIKSGGSSSEFLKADGSVDGNSYSTTSHNHALDSLSNVTITSNASGEILKWNGSAWVNNTLVEAGIASASHTHANANSTTSGFMSDTHYDKLEGIADNANNYSLPEATATVRGGIELFSNTDQSVAANTVSSTAGRTYGIQLNSAGQAVVNVPWSDTNTDTNTFRTVTAGGNTLGSAETLALTAGSNVSISESGGQVTISSTDTNTVYTHPTHAGDDISIDTGPLTGATVISDLDFNITTNTLGHVTDANGTIATRTLTAANLGISAPNAPTSLSASIVGETIDLTFNASSTSNIDAYLVYSSVDGGDYGLIQVIPPDDFSATMSVIDSAFTVTGTQAYRVYAMKYGILSSAGTASVSYTVSSAEPTDMSVVNLNNAYFVQWNPPSANERFVSAYNVYKHEAAASGSLSRSSASLVYSGLNTNFMYQISGNNNSNYHQFWVETTIA